MPTVVCYYVVKRSCRTAVCILYTRSSSTGMVLVNIMGSCCPARNVNLGFEILKVCFVGIPFEQIKVCWNVKL